MSTTTSHAGASLGHRLAEKLSLEVLGTEGHDLRIPCPSPTCQSSDAGRIHSSKAVAHCFSCGSSWSPFQLAELVIGDRQQAKAIMIELGIFEAKSKQSKSKNGHQKKASAMPNIKKTKPVSQHANDEPAYQSCVAPDGKLLGNPVEMIAAAKSIPVHAFRTYGARPIFGIGAAFLPSYGPGLQRRGDFTLFTVGGKGKWSRKITDERVAGLFLPHDHDNKPIAPAPGQEWCLVEGAKDSPTLYALGYNTAGLPTCHMHKEFASLFAGVNVVLVPDGDGPSIRGEKKSAARLSGVAASVRVARLPLELKPSKGGDVRDVLKLEGGEQLIHEAIANAVDAETFFANPDLHAELEAMGETLDTDGADDNNDLNANQPAEPSLQITNFDLEQNDDGDWKPVPVPMPEVLKRFSAATDGWPRRVGNSLFVADQQDVHWLDSVASLFGWAASKSGQLIDWKRGPSFVERADAFAEIRRLATCYTAVERLPHIPAIADHFYACGEYPTTDGSALQWLLDRFCPETPTDRDLLLSLFATPFWGGRSGGRPAFAITSDAGRGTGKTTVVSMLSRIVGGMLDFSSNEDIATIKQRLLSPEGASSRLVLLDNLKSLRFSWAELEALTTSPIISGKKLYVGEASRPNTITWAITLNGASLSTDMSQRCVIIKLAASIKSGSWQDETARFIDENRRQIIGDILKLLAGPAKPLARHSRWADWEDGVLSRLEDPIRAQQVIAERQQVADCEFEESELLVTYFRSRLIDLGYPADEEWIHIPTKTAAEWFCEATGERKSVTGASRILKQLVNEGRVTEIQIDPGHKYGRGFLWQGCQSTVDSARHYDLQDRIEKLLNEKFKKSKPTEF